MKKRVLSLILAAALILGCIPTAFAVDTVSSGSGSTVKGPLSLGESSNVTGNLLEGSGTSIEKTDNDGSQTSGEELTKFERSEWTPFSESEAAVSYEADDVVTFIVVTEDKPQLELYSVSEIAAQTASVQSYAKRQTSTLNTVKNKVKSAFGKEKDFAIGFTYTVATTGFSVTTAYGNKAEIEAMDGVKSVYVAPTFSLPEDGMDTDYSPYTNNASTMIGANVLNETGYTGKGMRIAILDTGIDLDHPNFEALPDDVLVDPMTQSSVNDIWKNLNASQMTNYLNLSYKSSKIPFVFNYVSGDFNVSNTYAGSDHGTHVAGIAAANKIDGSNVVGVAPDAQLVIMQVFQQGGGAGWDTIMAALEDCVRLEVDAVNLSLGVAAGYTDPEGEMLDTMNLFLDSDIQVLIASGNDTNNAYGNAWGLNMSLITDPDNGLAGTPSTYSAALAVASVDNDGYDQLYITVNGQDFGFQDTAATAATSFIGNFRSQELEYVVVPGLGEEADYEGLDVEGKVALISRGTISFPEKQAIAQEHGAIACVIYNNALGIFGMQINDGEGNIPAVSVSMAAGAYLIKQAGDDGVGTLQVCNADVKTFKIDRTVSSFSSWGVTPDLKLKPEIAGVGGSIYSTVDPEISGSYYGYMSGTSMATPQITGAMAVLIQYLDENYPELTGAEQRKVAANLLMSTADPIMATETLEYSPRAQGAGLADLVGATTSGAYLSNPAVSEGRPKAELGDDPDKTGVYTFSFEITNMTGAAKTYTFDSSVLTESIYAGNFIANSPYGLEAKVETPDQVTVPANSTVTVKATLTLTENDKAYLAQFPNGIYVEGYLYAIPAASGEGEQAVTLTMPMVGFYGDWSAADIFDSEDLSSYSLYPTVVYTYYSQLGTNPYFRSGSSGDEYNAFSYANLLDEIDFGMLRNAKYMYISVTDAATGELYYELDGYDLTKSYYNASYGRVIPMYLMSAYEEVWDGKDLNGNYLPNNTKVTYKFEAWLDDGDDVMDDAWSFDATLDTQAPELLNKDSLQEGVTTENGSTYLTLDLKDNHYIAAVIFMSEDGTIMGKYEVSSQPGQEYTGTYNITGFGEEFTIIVADYACNETEVDVVLDLEEGSGLREPGEMSKDRLYGCETFTGAAVEPGWFSADKADFSDYGNETYDSSNRYYSAEYVNGYLIAQSTATGNLELIIPSGTYWSSQVIAENNGSVGDYGVWVLYDMALDHSGTLAASYGVNYETDATDALLAVGWLYQGDSDGDGKDDGHNALFNIKFTNYGSVTVQEIAQVTGTENGGDLLTLGITTEGEVYGIDTDGILYSVGTTTEWDSSIGNYGDYVVKCTKIGVTDFVNETNYNGCNVIQSMGYDHNTGTMYWYAHSQYQVGYYWYNLNMTYTVDLETGKCTEVGTYGPGGLTCLFVPNDLESDLFEMGVQATGFSIPYEKYMVAGQSDKLTVEWKPWNAAPAEVTWTSSDESVATVDAEGRVTALAQGEAIISASAEAMLDGWWEVVNGSWIWHDPEMGIKTVQCYITVVPSEDALYSYIIADYNTWTVVNEWYTYADTTPHDITFVGSQTLTYTDPFTGETVEAGKPTWQGGTYYNGYVYTTTEIPVDDGTGAVGTAATLYKSKVTETDGKVTIGQPELIGTAMGVKISALGFDYNTGRMYCIEDGSVGGLGVIDLDTGAVDMMGTYSGDLAANSWICAMCVTADGTIVVADAYDNLYTLDPDTLEARQICYGQGSGAMYWSAMTYDYNTGFIYWNPCQGSMASPLYMVKLPESEWGSATVVELGDVATKYGVQQTVMFTIPETEPETNHIDTESIVISNGDSVIGLKGGTLQLNAVTVPARPTVQTKTWTSSDESVVTVDSYGSLTYVGVGTATVTVSISNKDGSTFTDSIEVKVLESAGEFKAFLAYEQNGSSYYDFWLSGNDYDLTHTDVSKSMINVYSLRSGTYYEGYYYGYDDQGQFLRIDAEDPAAYKVLGTLNLDTSTYQVTAMAMDYTTSTMYGLTLPADYDYSSLTSIQQNGSLVTIDLTNGAVTAVAELDFATPVFALACDKNGQLYAAGGSFDYYSYNSMLYKLDKDGTLTEYVALPGAGVYTGPTYYGNMQYNSQMTYDFGTDRLYLNATSDHQYYSESYGVYMIQLGDEPAVANLGKMKLNMSSSQNNDGDVFLSLMAFIPEADEIPVGPVNSVALNKTSARIPVGSTTQLTATVLPASAADTTVTWTTSDETVATVDENGLVTGISEGTVTITATSNEDGSVKAVCTVTVVNVSGPHSVAYTVSAQKDALISFNPALPGTTAVKLATLSGGSTIKGMAYAGNYLYYVQEIGYGYYLYRFDLTTKQTTEMGQMEAWTGVDDIAYDAANDLLYAVGGVYLYQYNMSSWSMGEYNSMSNYTMDSDYCTLIGVEVVDGAVYTFGNTFSYDSQVMKYSDMLLSDRTVVLTGVDLNLVAGSTDVGYDSAAGLFYIADAAHNIYSMDMDGNVEFVDILGDGIDLHGLTVDSSLKYTVTLTDGVDGEEIFADTAVYVDPSGSAYGRLPKPTRTGYTFAGWVDENGNSVTADTTVESDTTYTATWTANTYTVTLVKFNGEPNETVTVTYGQPVGELPVPVKTGYTFGGWFQADGKVQYTADTVYMIAGDVNLYAIWTANTYNVTLDANGGECGTSAITVTYGEAIGELPVPTKEGYTFIGWLDADGVKVLAETAYTVAADSTLTAQWAGNAYTITLDPGEGAELVTGSVNVVYGEAVNTLPEPTKEGYTFAGWFDADGNEYTAETIYTMTGDLSLTAKWTANTYTITLNPNGGVCGTATITVTYGEAVGELPVPTREGYEFKGWLSQSGHEITAETVYSLTADTELTASWAEISEGNTNTGDAMPITLIVAVLILSAFALVTLDVIRRKRCR